MESLGGATTASTCMRVTDKMLPFMLNYAMGSWNVSALTYGLEPINRSARHAVFYQSKTATALSWMSDVSACCNYANCKDI